MEKKDLQVDMGKIKIMVTSINLDLLKNWKGPLFVRLE